MLVTLIVWLVVIPTLIGIFLSVLAVIFGGIASVISAVKGDKEGR